MQNFNIIITFLLVKTVKNSVGKDVTRELVKNEDELLKKAEDFAGGHLDDWDNYKPDWFKSPDKKNIY